MSDPAPEAPEVTVARVGAGVVEGLRARVLRAGSGLDALRYEQDDDPRTASFAAVLGEAPDAPVGTATVFPAPWPRAPAEGGAWRLRAMATEDGLRGRGVGAAVLRAAVDHVVAEGGRLVWCDARVAARAFYERHGFTIEGEGYEVEGLVKDFGATRALDGLDLEVARGEVHGFLGPNGSGKSTTIRVLLGLLRPDAGRVRLLGGDPWRDAVELHRRLAYVPGDVVLWPNLTGGEVIDLLGRLRGGLDEARRSEMLDRFALDPTKRARTYSKGNRQKVALAAALSSDVELLVLDEPTSGLDPLMESEFQDCIREARDAGRTVLLSSHILAEVEALGDRISIIRQGRTVESDTLDELRHLTGTSLALEARRWPAWPSPPPSPLVVGVGVALHGLVPRATAAVWAVLALAVAVGVLGEGLDLPQWVRDLSPFTHVPSVPAVAVDALPLAVPAGVAAVLLAAGLLGFARTTWPEPLSRDGPVRAIRSYVGANSGPRTQRTHLMYRDRAVAITDLRVHRIPQIMDFVDLSAAARGDDLHQLGGPRRGGRRRRARRRRHPPGGVGDVERNPGRGLLAVYLHELGAGPAPHLVPAGRGPAAGDPVLGR